MPTPNDAFSHRPLPAAPVPPAPAPRPGSLVRRALPIALFVLIVGAIAWVTQNLPRGATRRDVAPPASAPETGPDRAAELKFLRTRAVWDPEDPDYLKEYEPGVEGHFDFPFQNPADRPMTLGFARTSCDCSKLKVAVLGPDQAAKLPEELAKEPFTEDPAWTWTELPQNDTQGIDVPANGGGVVRIYWNGRKESGSRLRLSIRMWMQPAGKTDDRSFETLEVPIILTDAVRYQPHVVNFGALAANGVAEEEVLFFSATRDRLPLKVVAAQVDSLFQVTVKDPLGPDELKALEQKLRKTENTRVRSAVRVHVVLKEQDGDRQLDQGPFVRKLPLELADAAQEVPAPEVKAVVKGDLEVGIPEDGGKVTLKTFPAQDGIRKVVPLWTETAGALTLESVSPPYLDVKLEPRPKESRPGRAKWALVVVVPAGTLVGPLEDSVIILRTPTKRRVRIPVVGTAGQG